jgi:hypothetical protein
MSREAFQVPGCSNKFRFETFSQIQLFCTVFGYTATIGVRSTATKAGRPEDIGPNTILNAISGKNAIEK